MKRFMVFLLLFPLFCLLLFAGIKGFPSAREALPMTALAYALMAGPAILVGLVDRALKKPRPWLCAPS
jgi:hypothetical protein